MKFRFGEIVRADYKPGLHFLMPFVNNVRKFDKRILTEDYPVRAVPDQRRQDPAHQLLREVAHHRRLAVLHLDRRAAARTSPIAGSAKSSRTASRASSPAARSSRSWRPSAASSSAKCSKIAGANVDELGITLVDVRVKRIDLPDEVSDSVFNRMRQDFARQAAQLRAEGSAVSEQTRAEADRQRTEILAEAYRAGGNHARRGRCTGGRHLCEGLRRATRSSTRSTAACRPTAGRSASRATCW